MLSRERDQAGPSGFCISAKTRLSNLERFWGSSLRKRVANDIATNAMELLGERRDVWTNVLNYVRHYYDNRCDIGEKAIYFSIAPTIGSVATKLGLDMHAPEIVYMSGYYFLKSLEETLLRLEQRQRSTVGKKTDEEKVHMAASTVGRLRECLDQYAKQNLPQTEIFTGVLQHIVNKRHRRLSEGRKGLLFTLMRERKIAEALEILEGNMQP